MPAGTARCVGGARRAMVNCVLLLADLFEAEDHIGEIGTVYLGELLGGERRVLRLGVQPPHLALTRAPRSARALLGR